MQVYRRFFITHQPKPNQPKPTEAVDLEPSRAAANSSWGLGDRSDSGSKAEDRKVQVAGDQDKSRVQGQQFSSDEESQAGARDQDQDKDKAGPRGRDQGPDLDDSQGDGVSQGIGVRKSEGAGAESDADSEDSWACGPPTTELNKHRQHLYERWDFAMAEVMKRMHISPAIIKKCKEGMSDDAIVVDFEQLEQKVLEMGHLACQDMLAKAGATFRVLRDLDAGCLECKAPLPDGKPGFTCPGCNMAGYCDANCAASDFNRHVARECGSITRWEPRLAGLVDHVLELMLLSDDLQLKALTSIEVGSKAKLTFEQNLRMRGEIPKPRGSTLDSSASLGLEADIRKHMQMQQMQQGLATSSGKDPRLLFA